MSETQGKGAFDALLEDIGGVSAAHDELAKALPVAAEEGDEDGKDGKDKDGKDTSEDDAKIAAAAKEGEGDALGKSFTFKDADGVEREAIDGTDLLKSLLGRVDAGEAKTAEVLTAAMGVIKQQGAMLKSLSETVGALAGQGRGRKAVVSIVEKPAGAAEALAKSHASEGGVSGEEFMAKALACQAAGKLSGRDVATAESYINMNQAPPAAIVSIVLGASA